MGRKLQLVIFASIGLNLIFIGVFIGYGFKGCGKGQHDKGPPPELMAQISPEQKKRVSKALTQLRRKGREERRRIRAERRKTLAILSAPQFKPEAYRQAMNQLHELQGERKDEMVETVIKLASQLDQKDRQALAAFLAQGPGGRGKGRGPARHWRAKDRRGPGIEGRPGMMQQRERMSPPPEDRPGPPPMESPEGPDSDL